MIDKFIPIATAAPVDLQTNYDFGNIPTVGDAFTHLVKPGFAVAAVALVIYFLIAALRYLTSGGEKEAIAGARAMLTHSIVGFLLLIMLFLVLKYIPEIFNLGIKFIQ
jgi:hypothetical protein